MSEFFLRTYNNKTIRQRQDGYLSATDMCKACGKLIGDWNTNKSTKEYLQALEESMGIPIDQLIEVNESQGTNDQRGTWVHRKVAIYLAQWLSPEFSVQVSNWIEELLTTGKVELNPQPKLPPYEEAVKIAHSVRDITDTLFDQPKLVQFLIDHSISHLMEQNNLDSVQYRGVVEIAEEMNLPVNLKNRCSLGRFVKARLSHLIKEEKRLVNGQMRNVACYPDCDEVREAIKQFFA